MSEILIGSNDVVSLTGEERFFDQKTFTAQEFVEQLSSSLKIHKVFFSVEGVACRYLSNGTWQEGKIRLALSFVPAESEEDAP